ncbi:MAG: LamG-like jellyroll fold domain-containing protein [Phycisphaerales bacterium]|jgi:hypothetical protein
MNGTALAKNLVSFRRALALTLLAGATQAMGAPTTFQTLFVTSMNEYATSIERTPKGGYVAVGDSFNLTATRSVMLVRTDKFGNQIGTTWFYNSPFGANAIMSAQSVRVVSDGNYVIAGEITPPAGTTNGIFAMKVNSATGAVMWCQTYDAAGFTGQGGTVIRERSGGGFVIIGRRNIGPVPLGGVLITTDKSGFQLSGCEFFNAAFGSLGLTSFNDVRENADGTFSIVGWTRRNPNFPRESLLLRTQSTPCVPPQWANSYFTLPGDYAGESLDLSRSLTTGANFTGLAATGSYINANNQPGAFALLVTNTGNPIWEFTTPSLVTPQSIRANPAGDFILGGVSPVNPTTGISDGEIMRVAQNGTITWRRLLSNASFPNRPEMVNEVIPTPDGGFALGARADNYFGANADFWLSKTNALGTSNFQCDVSGTFTQVFDQGVRPVQLQPVTINNSVPIGIIFRELQIEHPDICNRSHGCVTPPTGMSLWVPLDEPAGVVATNVANPAFNGVDVNAPAHIIGSFVDNSRNYNSTQYTDVPDYPSINPGQRSFTLDAWVNPRNTQPNVGMIVNKFSNNLFATNGKGYAMFIFNGNLWAQIGNGANAVNINSGLAVTPLTWSHTAMVFDGTSNTVVFFVNGTASPAMGIGAAAGSHDSSGTTFRIGAGSGAPPTNGFFVGGIDEVEFHRRALTAAEINDVYLAGQDGKCKTQVHGYTARFCEAGQNSVSSSVQICNYSSVAHTYNYSFGGTPVGPGCTVAGPTNFAPPIGSVMVPAGGCVSVPVTIQRPAGLTFPGATSCYETFITDATTGESVTAEGRVVDARTWCFDLSSSTPRVPFPTHSSVLFPVHFTNQQSAAATLSVRVHVEDGDGNADLKYISLDGRVPGTPELISIPNIPSGGGADVNIIGVLIGLNHIAGHLVVLEADLDGDGTYERVGEWDAYDRDQFAPPCDPDVNQDGNVDQGDVDYLIGVVAGSPNPSGIDPDFNQDGNVDQGDVDALIDVVAGGNCP